MIHATFHTNEVVEEHNVMARRRPLNDIAPPPLFQVGPKTF